MGWERKAMNSVWIEFSWVRMQQNLHTFLGYAVNNNYFNRVWWNCGRKWLAFLVLNFWVFFLWQLWGFCLCRKNAALMNALNWQMNWCHTASGCRVGISFQLPYYVHFCRSPMLIVHFNQSFHVRAQHSELMSSIILIVTDYITYWMTLFQTDSKNDLFQYADQSAQQLPIEKTKMMYKKSRKWKRWIVPNRWPWLVGVSHKTNLIQSTKKWRKELQA